MRALLGQLSPAPGDLQRNADTVCEAVSAHPAADLAVFPELFLSGYDAGRAAELAIAPDHGVLVQIRETAREHATSVAVGFVERVAGGVANAVACIDACGEHVATYRKTHLFGDEERRAFVAGDSLCLAELAGHRVGPLVCFDMEFPEPARALTRAGAELLLTVAANMEPYAPDHALAARARALDNRRPHVYVNRVGSEAGHRFVGGSAAIRADGSLQAALGDEPAVVEVDLDIPGTTDDESVDYLAHLRADLRVEDPVRPTIGARA